MNMHGHDSLSPEEQALAGRLLRLGGAEGPPAALDARILGAARAAAGSAPAPAQRRRWFAWSAMPGAAVTAVGTAAAFVLAVGVVWQLQPDERHAPVRKAADDDGGFVPVQVIERQARPAVPLEPATSGPAQGAPPPDARMRTREPVRRPAMPVPAASRSAAGDESQRVTALPVPAPEAAQSATAEAASASTAEPALPPAIASSQSTRASEDDADAGPPPRRRPTYTSAARATPRMRSASARPPRDKPRGADTRSAGAPASVAGFGPAAADARLAPADWLQRIRDRRARGDSEAAAESLRGFRRAHPRIRLPDDLRALDE